MRRAALVVGTLAVIALGGCGGEAADLFAVDRSGSIPAARLALRVTDDGRASCNGAPLVDISSAQLITARASVRDLTATGDRSYRPGPASVFSYRVRAQDATVAWSDDSPRQPPALFELAKLVRDVAKGPCRLPR